MKGVGPNLVTDPRRGHQPHMLIDFRGQQVMRPRQLVIMFGLGRQLYPAAAGKIAGNPFLASQPLDRIDRVAMRPVPGFGDRLAEPCRQCAIVMRGAVVALAAIAPGCLAHDLPRLQQNDACAALRQR